MQSEAMPASIPEPEQPSDEEATDSGQETTDRPQQENDVNGEVPAEPNLQSTGTVNVNSPLNQVETILAIGNADIHFTILEQNELGQKADGDKSLYGVTRALPQRDVNLSPSLRGQLDANRTRLRESQLILVSCYNQKYALDAAQAVVENLNLAHQEQKRVLYFESPEWGGSEISIYSLMQKKVEAQDEIAIIVDALEDSAQTFCESLFGNHMKASLLKEDLRKKKIFLLCVVDSTYIEKRMKEGGELNHPVWKIPFLLPLLERHGCLELGAEILRQREAGRWSKDESEFFFEITSYINSRQLAFLVGKGGKPQERKPVDKEVDEAGPIGKAVLYVTTYFPNSTPTEFCRIVESLLCERAETVTTPSYILNDNGSKVLTQTEQQVSLVRAWGQYKDVIFKKWLQEMISPRDSNRVIGFYDPTMRESLKEHFEKEHRFYLLDQFDAIQKQGILFYPSQRIAESTTRLTIDRMLNYPDQYDTLWLVNTIIDLKQKLDAETNSSDNITINLRRISQRNSLRWAYRRISELMSGMLEHSQLQSEVDNCLDYLIKATAHDWTLNIIKQLRFSPQFDVIYWIKRLLDQADEKTRLQTYYYLLAYLRKEDSNIYVTLARLATWIPEGDRNPNTYSPSNRFGLRLLIQYFLETTARFDRRYYGAWPSRYPLFAVKTKAAATEGLALLTKWLFHPGLKSTLRSMKVGTSPYTLIADLLAEWSFILLGPNAGSGSNFDSGPAQASDSIAYGANHSAPLESELDPLMLLDLLLEQISSRVNIFQRSELLSYWNELDRDLLKLITSYLRPNDQQRELMWKRDCVRKLTKRFQSLTARSKAS